MIEPVAAQTKVKKSAYIPRRHFLQFHNRTQRFAILCCHRRSGKTVAAINELIERALWTKKKDSQYGYVAPFLKQAKRIAWNYLLKYTQHVRKRFSEAELYVDLVNGSRIYVLGADAPDDARGLFFDGIVLDECAQIKPSFLTEVIRPSLADRKGWLTMMGTPKGKGNLLYQYWLKALSNKQKWFSLTLKASETEIIGKQELEELREDMDENEYAQEFECSFDAALKGSFYGKGIARLVERNKIVDAELYDSRYPVSIALDLGKRDHTAIWYWQIIAGEVRFVDYWQSAGYDAEEVCEMLRHQPYHFKEVWLPHDAFHSTFQSKKSTFDTFASYFGSILHKVPDPDGDSEHGKKDQGIDATRKFLRRFPILFSAKNCAQGIECLKNYSREWQSRLGQFSDNAKHDKYSHGADAFRYTALSIQWEDIQRSADIDEQVKSATMHPNQNIRPARINRSYTLQDAIVRHEHALALQRTGRRPHI
jgi:phage terminase large subunit